MNFFLITLQEQSAFLIFFFFIKYNMLCKVYTYTIHICDSVQKILLI